jgi:hypothetical protein
MRHPPDIPEKYESDYGNIGHILCTKVAQLRQGINALKPTLLTLKTPTNIPKLTNTSTPNTPTTPVATKTPLLIVSTGAVPTTPTSPAVKTFTVPSSVIIGASSSPTISGVQSSMAIKKT